MPQSVPGLSQEEIAALGRLPENAAIAKLLNLYLGEGITAWDLDFSVGRRWARARTLDRRTVLGQCWYNPEGSLDYILDFLSERLGGRCGLWARVSIKLAVMGMLLSRMAEEEAEETDLAVLSGDFSGVLAGLYLKQMGFPVGKLICCCNENNSVWELVHLGQLRTDAVCEKTGTPLADVVLPMGLEHLLYRLGGEKTAVDYARLAYMGLTYEPEQSLLRQMQGLLFVGVASESRLTLALTGVLKNYGCLLCPYTAILYAGVQDYRSKAGENRRALLLSERSPELEAGLIASLLDVPGEQVRAYLNMGR